MQISEMRVTLESPCSIILHINFCHIHVRVRIRIRVVHVPFFLHRVAHLRWDYKRIMGTSVCPTTFLVLKTSIL